MERRTPNPSDAPLVIAVRRLAAEYGKTADALKALLDQHDDVFTPQMNHPLGCGVPLPQSLLIPQRDFVDEFLSAVHKLRKMTQSLEAWADDIEMTIRDAIVETKQFMSNRSTPY